MSVFERGRLNPDRRRRLGRAVGVSLAAITALTATGIFIADKMADGSNASGINQGLVTGMNTLEGPDCPPVNPAVLEVVQTIFDTKDPKELKKIGPEVPNKYDKYVRLQAERFGVTLQNPNNALDKLFYSETVEDVLGGFNDFLSGFGYTATIPTQADEYDKYLGVDTVTGEDLDPSAFALGAYAAIKTLQYLPTEVAKLAGNVEIRFVQFPPSEDSDIPQIVGRASNDPRRVYVDMKAFYFGNDFIIPHEIGHQIDVSTCGIDGFRVDSAYSSLNSPEFEYLGDNWVSVKDKEVADVVEGAYGMNDKVEDKAVLMQENLTEAEGFGDMAPVLRSKFELIISRIEERAPRFAGYLRAISRRHDK